MKKFKGSEFHQLIKFAHPEKYLLLIGTFFLGVGSLVALLFPQAVRITLDEALESKSLALVDQMGILMVFFTILHGVAASFRYFLFTYAGERTVKRIRRTLFSRLLDQEAGFFDQEKTGDLMSRLNSDSTVLQNALSVNISMILRNLAGVVGGLVFLFYTSWELSLLLLVVLPPCALLVVKFGKRIRHLSKKVQESLGDASAIADETLSNVRMVRSFAAEKQEVSRYDNALSLALGIARDKIVYIAKFMGLITLLGMSAVVAILWLGGRMVVNGELSIGTLSALFSMP